MLPIGEMILGQGVNHYPCGKGVRAKLNRLLHLLALCLRDMARSHQTTKVAHILR